MNYKIFFARLVSFLYSAEASAELLAQVEQIAAAPVWDDQRLMEMLMYWTGEIAESLEDDNAMPAQVIEMRRAAFAEIRGEKGSLVRQMTLEEELDRR